MGLAFFIGAGMDQLIQFNPMPLTPPSPVDCAMEVPHYIIFYRDAGGDISGICCICINDGDQESCAVVLFSSKVKARRYLKNTNDEELSIVHCNCRYLFAHMAIIQSNQSLKYAVVDPLDDSPLQGLRAFDITAICDEIDDGKADHESVYVVSFFLTTAA